MQVAVSGVDAHGLASRRVEEVVAVVVVTVVRLVSLAPHRVVDSVRRRSGRWVLFPSVGVTGKSRWEV
jgi:hypothetical protein